MELKPATISPLFRLSSQDLSFGNIRAPPPSPGSLIIPQFTTLV